ncbi:hypothetical protein LINGRAHAP2_LOCUS31045 [Linum grandiflorum]
MKLLRFARS